MAICIVSTFCTTAMSATGTLRASGRSFSLLGRLVPVNERVEAALADLDGDGHPDLVSRARGAYIVQRSDGSGGFGSPSYTADPDGFSGMPAPFALADMDADGHPDIVDNRWFVPGRGDGTFEDARQAARVDPTADPVASPVVADVTGDGITDIAVLTRQIRVRPGLGDGSRDSTIVTWLGAGGSERGSLVLADVNHDGILDVAASDGAAHTWVQLGAGNGTFLTVALDASGIGGAVHVADLNEDGHPDLTSGVGVFLGDGAGAFASSDPLPLPIEAVADLNGDGHLDAALADSSGLTLAHGDGTGHFTLGARLAVGPDPFRVFATDLDGDGHPDLIVLSRSGPTAEVYLNHGAGFFVPPRLPTPRAPVALARLDANRDGHDDLLVGSRGSRSVSLLLGDGHGSFVPGSSAEVAPGLARLLLADLEGDGVPEIAVLCDSADVISVIPLSPAGVLGPRSDTAVDAEASAIAASDIDGDGRDELLVASPSSVAILQVGPGPGLQSTLATIPGPPSGAWVSIAAGDWSGDGRPDLIMGSCWPSSSSSGATVMLRSDGAGVFSQTGQIYGGGWARIARSSVSDLDGDGDLDLVSFTGADSAGSRAIRPACGFLANGLLGPTWQLPEALDVSCWTPGVLSDLAIVDVTGDGRPEVLAADLVGNAVHILVSRPDGFELAPFSVIAGNGPSALAAGDFDEDGRPDIAVAGAHEDAITLLMSHPDLPTPVAASLIEARAEPSRVSLLWRVAVGAALRVERSEGSGMWSVLATVGPDGLGNVGYVDDDVTSGRRYGYRLRESAGSEAILGDESWVDVPSTAFALNAIQNPAYDGLRIRFALPDPGAARLELFDLAGRRVESREVGSLGVGDHLVTLGESPRLPPGLYQVRLTSGLHVAVAQALLLRR